MRHQHFFGWRVVAGAFALATIGWGLGFYGPPIYFQAVQAKTGWPADLVAIAVTVHFLSGAITVANLARLHRHLGLARTTAIGAAVLAAGIVGWAIAPSLSWLYLAAIVSGAGWATTGAAAINAIVAPWFVRRRPAALSTAYNGASIGGVVFSPVWAMAIAVIGFERSAMLVGIATTILVGLLAWHLFAQTPNALGLTPDGDPDAVVATPPKPTPTDAAAPLWRDRRFLTLGAGMAAGLFAQVGLLAHLFSYLVPQLGQEVAGLALAMATALAMTGRTLVGWLMPTGADRRAIAAACYGGQLLGIGALMAGDGGPIAMTLTGVAIFGLGIGNATSLPPLIAQAEFTPSQVQRVVPLIVAGSQAAYAFAPAAFAVVARFGGGAFAIFLGVGLIQVIAIVCLLAGRR